MLVGVSGVAIAIAGIAASTAWLGRHEPDPVVTAAGDLVTYADPARGFTVAYPPTWHRATSSLTPHLGEPGEILSLGTGDLPSGGTSCAQFPVAALEAMSTSDALLTVQERSTGDFSFPPRPIRFPPDGSENISEVPDCLAAPPPFDNWWFSFQDGGRSFHVLVAIGTQASEQTRAEAWEILGTFTVDPPAGVYVPSVMGFTLGDAGAALERLGLRGAPADGDPTEVDALVVAQEPPPDVRVSPGDVVGLRTAVVTPELCAVLRDLPDFSNGATWELPVGVLQRVVDVAGPALNADTERVLDHIRSGGDAPDNAASRALDRLVVHRRACG
jgi:hypothetical protein